MMCAGAYGFGSMRGSGVWMFGFGPIRNTAQPLLNNPQAARYLDVRSVRHPGARGQSFRIPPPRSKLSFILRICGTALATVQQVLIEHQY